jgi:hypothetical protein
MLDQQPCWRCKRLPYAASSISPAGYPTQFDPYAGQRAFPVEGDTPQRRRGSPCLLWVGGLAALALVVGLVVVVVLSGQDTKEPPATDDLIAGEVTRTDSDPGLPVLPAIPLAPDQSPVGVTAESVAGDGAGGAGIATPLVAVGPFAETAIAMQPTVAPSATFTPLPTSTPAPSFTPNTAPTVVVCPGAPPTRLAINGKAVVFNVASVRLRAEPGLNAEILSNVSVGVEVAIIGGPACTESFLWWQVQLANGRTGWVAEGQPGTYFLEPR